MDYKYKKIFRIRKRPEYRNLFRKSKRISGIRISLDIYITSKKQSKLGITAPKKYGNAVERNRFKRLVREAFRTSVPHLSSSLECNVYPRKAAKNATMQELKDELLKLVNHGISSQ